MPTSLERIQALMVGNDPLRWVFAGDSITHGAKHTYGKRDYVEQFSERLRWELKRHRDCVIKTGVSGWQIGTLLTDIDWSLLQHRPHVASINMGMNDCCRGADGLVNFERDYNAVLDALPDDCAVILHTPNDVLPSATGRVEHLEKYVRVIRKLAGERSAVLVDHFAEWNAVRPDYWCSDAIHPNDLGHIVMANCLFKAIRQYDPQSEVCRLFVPRPEAKV